MPQNNTHNTDTTDMTVATDQNNSSKPITNPYKRTTLIQNTSKENYLLTDIVVRFERRHHDNDVTNKVDHITEVSLLTDKIKHTY